MSRQLFSHPTEFFFWQKPGWDPVWDPKIPKPQNDFFKKCSNLTSEQCFWAKMSWKIDFEQRKNPKVPKNTFFGHFSLFVAFCRFLSIFQKSRFWRFCRCFSSAVRCPFELKITWGLCLALKSSQNNFQLKRTAHGWGSDLEKTPKSTFSEILKNRPKSEKWPKKAFLGTYGFSSVLFSIFQLILATFYDFFYLNW